MGPKWTEKGTWARFSQRRSTGLWCSHLGMGVDTWDHRLPSSLTLSHLRGGSHDNKLPFVDPL